MSNLVIAEYSDIVAIADALREKTGETKRFNLDEIPGFISNIQAKTTKTIYINWDEDWDYLGEVIYVSNGEIVRITCLDGVDTIEAEGGIVIFTDGGSLTSYYTSNFIDYILDTDNYILLVAKQDGETIYIVTTGEQGA